MDFETFLDYNTGNQYSSKKYWPTTLFNSRSFYTQEIEMQVAKYLVGNQAFLDIHNPYYVKE
jgi:hypothetical protein